MATSDALDALNVLILMDFSDATLDQLQSLSPRLHLTRMVVKSPAEVPSEIWATTDILYTFNIIPDPDLVPRLRWVQHHLAGPNNLLTSRLITRPALVITTTSGLNTTAIAEHAFTMLMALAHNVPAVVRNQQTNVWPLDRFTLYPPRDLAGSTLGIVGYGKIGHAVARMARCFGMDVLATRRHVARPTGRQSEAGDDYAGRIYPPEATRSMIAQCDFIVIAVPLTPETHGSIDRQTIAAMKPGAFFINVARGAVVDEAALIEALQTRRIAGAALDVYAQEPLLQTSPLCALDNVILTPHMAGNTKRYHEKAAAIFAENLGRYLAGEPLKNVVDTSRGY